MKKLLFGFVITLFLLLSFPSESQAQTSLPIFETAECPIDVPDSRLITCGNLITLEDYNDPDGRTISMSLIILHNKNGNPSNEAMLFTEGGPGYSSLDSAWWLSNSSFGDYRDIVILEQRGNKYAHPSLDCDYSIWWEEKPGNTPCLDKLRQNGIHLEHYTTANIATDINALMESLNYTQWILFSTSYSTRLMQLVMTLYPSDIHGVLLVSVSPVHDNRYLHDPEHTSRALQVMFDDCEANPACSKAFPDLESNFYEVVARLNNEPQDFKVTLPQSNTMISYQVDGDTFISFMDGSAFYQPAYLHFETAYLPLLIDKVAEGKMDLLYPWVKTYVSRWGNNRFNWGLYFAVNCQDDAAYLDAEIFNDQIAAYPELDGYFRHRAEIAICDSWGLKPVSSLPEEPVSSTIPTLVLAGTYDPITPPEWSQTALANLDNYTFIEFPSSGHSVLTDNPCASQITLSFINNPAEKLNLQCMDSLPKSRFVPPEDVIIAPAMYEIHYDELGYSLTEERLFLGSLFTLIGSGLFGIVVGFTNLFTHRKNTRQNSLTRVALPLLIVFAILVFVWAYSLRFTLQSVANESANVLRFGLPASYWWIFTAALIIGLLTIGLLYTTIQIWINKYWSPLARVAFSAPTLAGVTLFCLLARWSIFTALFR